MKKFVDVHEFGRSMIETVGVLAVMGLLTSAAFVLITSATRSQRISRAQDDVANIAMTIRSMSAASRDFSNLSCGTNNTCDSRDLLAALKLPTTTPFGNDSYYSVVYNPNYPDIFGVLMNNIDSAYCNGLSFKSFKDAIAGGCGYEYKNTKTVAYKSNTNSVSREISFQTETRAERDIAKDTVVLTNTGRTGDFFSIYFEK